MVGKVTPNTMLSASRLPAVMGMSKYRSPNDELMVSIDAINGKAPEDITNESMQWGNELEPVILAKAAERLGVTGLQTEHPEARFHPKLPLCCSLDGTADGGGITITTDAARGIYVVGEDWINLNGIGVIEAKLTASAPEDVLPLWRGPIQLQAQMEIIGAEWGVVATLYQGTTLRLFIFAKHDGTVQRIADVAQDFQRRLHKWETEGIVDQYEPVSSKDADRTWPQAQADADPVELDDEAASAARLIVDNKSRIEELQAEIEKCEIVLKSKLQDAEAGIAGRFQVRWPMRHYKAQPQKVVPAKEAHSIRQSTLSIKETSDGNR